MSPLSPSPALRASAASTLGVALLVACAQPPLAPSSAAVAPAPAPQASQVPEAPQPPQTPQATPAPPSPRTRPQPPGATTPSGNGGEAAAAEAGPLGALAWLAGCWQGTVNQREFREQWLPLRGATLVGVGQQASRGSIQDYEFLRLEARADGVFFTQFSGDLKPTSFRLASTTTDDKDTVFTFANTAAAFPARLVYRRGVDGWLYETIEGTLDGRDRRVIYPFRRVDCETGELILR